MSRRRVKCKITVTERAQQIFPSAWSRAHAPEGRREVLKAHAGVTPVKSLGHKRNLDCRFQRHSGPGALPILLLMTS